MLEDMVKLELMVSIAPHKAQVLGSDTMMAAKLVRCLHGKGGRYARRQSIVHLGIDCSWERNWDHVPGQTQVQKGKFQKQYEEVPQTSKSCWNEGGGDSQHRTSTRL